MSMPDTEETLRADVRLLSSVLREILREIVFITINGIAAGLQTAG